MKSCEKRNKVKQCQFPWGNKRRQRKTQENRKMKFFFVSLATTDDGSDSEHVTLWANTSLHSTAKSCGFFFRLQISFRFEWRTKPNYFFFFFISWNPFSFIQKFGYCSNRTHNILIWLILIICWLTCHWTSKLTSEKSCTHVFFYSMRFSFFLLSSCYYFLFFLPHLFDVVFFRFDWSQPLLVNAYNTNFLFTWMAILFLLLIDEWISKIK